MSAPNQDGDGAPPGRKDTPTIANRLKRILRRSVFQPLPGGGFAGSIMMAGGFWTDKQIRDFARAVFEEAISTEGGQEIIRELLNSDFDRKALLRMAWFAGSTATLVAIFQSPPKHGSN